MKQPGPATLHDVDSDMALTIIRAFNGPLLLDLDETLYLRNSTEDFIDSAKPGIAAVILMKFLDWIKPWHWTGGDATRDVWRVRMVMLLLPWTAWSWKQRAVCLAKEFTNQPLASMLRTHSCRPIIVTMGFQSIVQPLVAAINLGETRIIAARSSCFEDRLRGKLGLTVDALGEDVVRSGMVVTDSPDDLPLLNACARPMRTVWPDARYQSAHSRVYIPGRYLSQVKRPGERYILRGILQEDFAFWLLSSIALAVSPLRHVAGLLFLLLSFWTIYECGYVDNDRVGATYEKEPKLSPAFHEAPVATPVFEPWIWALIAGAVAIPLIRWPAPFDSMDYIRWFGILLGTHAWFSLYNRFDKPTRVWLFPGLQLARTAAFTVLVPVATIGMAALSAHVLAKWLPYYVYRQGGRDWPETPLPLVRLLFFIVMMLVLLLTQGASALISWTAFALLGWNVFRARADLMKAVKSARRLDRPGNQREI